MNGDCNARGSEECLHYGACFEAGQCVRPRPPLPVNAVVQRIAIDGVEVYRRPSEGTASARRINRDVPLKSCGGSGCNYPEGGCMGVCS